MNLGRCDGSSHQKLVWLPGDMYTLAVSNTLTILGSQTNSFFTKKKDTKKDMEGSYLHVLLGQLIVNVTSERWSYVSAY